MPPREVQNQNQESLDDLQDRTCGEDGTGVQGEVREEVFLHQEETCS